ncbi:hypothetical protein F5878DRAFT_648043, partial [Lentinula raphanica]
TEFKIVDFSTKHTVPDMTSDIAILAKALEDEKIQSYVVDRPANDTKTPVRDLFEEGSKYPNEKGAFKTFRKDTRVAENLGSADIEMGSLEVGTEEDYEITMEDLAVDEEEQAYGALEQITDFIDEFDDEFN